ncbi:sensor histidine kinase [Joostella sp.]|uniref:sensor histidine kinase n=1 Tax=Joostella sp. TaxID=2231138 RepID=UPI003A922B30
MLNFKKGYIIVFVISVIGLSFIQYQYLKLGLNLAKVQFNTKVGQALQTIKTDLSSQNELTFLIDQAITKDESYFTLSVDSIQDASSHFLNDFLVDRLLERGVKSDFQYRLYKNDSTVYLVSPSFEKYDNEELKFPVVLSGYLPNKLGERLILELQFKDLATYFLSQLNGLTIPSLIFMVAIIIVVVWVFRSLYWQRNVITTTNDFINNLTHELKTPVFSIGLATKLLEEKATEETKPIIAIVREQNDKLKVHVEKVLDLAGIESNRSVLKLEKHDFYPVLENLCASFSKLSELEKVDFKYLLEGDSYMIFCEIAHLENAINNLLDNAKKYSEGIPKIRLKSFIKDGYFYVTVKDEGIGIHEGELKNVFKKYHRISSGDLHNVRGYGLGLSYVKQVVKLHNGKVQLESKPSIGTTVTIKIPVK